MTHQSSRNVRKTEHRVPARASRERASGGRREDLPVEIMTNCLFVRSFVRSTPPPSSARRTDGRTRTGGRRNGYNVFLSALAMQMQKPVQQHCFLPSVAAVVKFHVYVCTHEKKGLKPFRRPQRTAHNAKGHCNCGADQACVIDGLNWDAFAILGPTQI